MEMKEALEGLWLQRAFENWALQPAQTTEDLNQETLKAALECHQCSTTWQECVSAHALLPPMFKHVVVKPGPFAEGALRVVYDGLVRLGGQSSPSWRGWRVQNTDFLSRDSYAEVAVKQYKRHPPGGVAVAAAVDMYMLERAAELADKFNKDMNPDIPIKFAQGLLYKEKTTGEILLVEPKLTEFFKMSSNTGWVATPGREHRLQVAVTQAFSHWTWCASEHACLVCDIQGTSGLLLTDPAIHTTSERTSLTDLGERGICLFFKTHVCNEFCMGLERPDDAFMNKFGDLLPPVERTTFWFETVKVSDTVHDQLQKTCYAHCVATLIRAAEQRIIGRKRQAHDELLTSVIAKHGSDGGVVLDVLADFCPPRGLHFQTVGARDAEDWVRRGHAVGIVFWWTDKQWDEFVSFFKSSPTGVLSSLPPRAPGENEVGHATVAVEEMDSVWLIKNSWGKGFADGGCFRIRKDVFAPSSMYIHVFWYEQELHEDERQAFKAHESGARQPFDGEDGFVWLHKVLEDDHGKIHQESLWRACSPLSFHNGVPISDESFDGVPTELLQRIWDHSPHFSPDDRLFGKPERHCG